MQHRTGERALPRRRSAAGTAWMAVASLLAGGGSYLFQILSSRGLGEEAFAPIGVLWTIQYLLVAVPLFSIETYLVRAVEAAGGRFPRERALAIGASILAVALLTVVATWPARHALFAGQSDLVLLAGLLALSYGAYMVARGTLAGRRRYGLYGTTSVIESGVRLLLAIPVLLVVGTTRGLAWVMPVGAVVGSLLFLGSSGARPEGVQPKSCAPSAALATGVQSSVGRYLVITSLSGGISQALLAGGPLALVALGAGAGDISVFFVTFTAARIPLVLAYGGLLSRLMPSMAELHRKGSERGIRKLGHAAVGVTLASSILVAGLGAWLGPRLVGLFFGSAFEPSAQLAAGAAGGVILACGAMFLNQFLLASGEERRTVEPWIGGLALAAVVLSIGSLGPMMRVTIAFVLGELAALIGLWLMQQRAIGGRAMGRDPLEMRAQKERG